jgi:uncharacterized membrane protein
MLRLVLATLWRRRAQTALLLLLATVAATGAATAPGYVTASLRALAAASVDDAPVPDRVVTVTNDAEVSDRIGADLTTLAGKATTAIGRPGFTTVPGAEMVAVVSNGLQRLAYRENVCDHVAIDGACPAGSGELLLPTALADRLGVGVGDTVALRGRTEIAPVPMRVVGRYRPLDPFELYWGNQAEAAAGERLADTGIFTPLATFAALRPNRADISVDLIATPDAYRDADPEAVARAAEHAALVLGAEGIRVTSGLRRLTDRLGDERRLVVNGVVIGVGELLIVCWLALFLAIRRTADTRRGDIGLLKLRGTRRRDLWLLIGAQSVLPLIAGGLLGLALGPALARRLAGPGETSLALTAAAVGLAVLGAAVAALAAERRTLNESVATLSRRVTRPRLGRVAIVDGVVVVLAAAGAYQSTVDGSGGVALLAPLLLALAVGVLATRLIPLAANRFGGRALRAGRLGTGLTAMHLARRTGTASVVGVVVVVVAVLTATTLAWSRAAEARADRAVAEIGGPRVLTVRSESPHELLTTVRAADPDGRSALAVVRTDAAAGTVLAVDTTRLSAFTPQLASYGLPDWGALAEVLHPAGYTPVTVTATGLTLDTTWTPATTPGGSTAAPVALEVHLVGPDGAPLTASTGPLSTGRHSANLTVPACAGGCRLVGLTLSSGSAASTVDVAPAGSTLTVHALSGVEGLLTDRTRWRAALEQAAQVPDIAVGPDGLRLGIGPGVPAGATSLSAAAYVADAPSPLPVARAGDVSLDRADPRIAVLGPDVVPVRVALTAAGLPSVGRGVLADLEYADRLTGGAGEAVQQVWLADTPAGEAVAQRLTAAGITVVADQRIAARRAALDARGPATALRFGFGVALVLVAMGLLSFAVAATAERRSRGAELAALRRQGLPRRVVRRVGIGGYPVLGLLAVGLGAATGIALDRLLPPQLPVFADGSGPAAATVPLLPFALAVGLAGLAVLVVALEAGVALTVAVRRGPREATWSV